MWNKEGRVMKNNKILFGIIGIIALILVNVVVFVSVKDFTDGLI